MTKRTKTADVALAPPPPGSFLDAAGRWVPGRYLSEADRLRHATVLKLVRRCQGASRTLESLKRTLFEDLAAHVKMVGEAYGVKLSGRNGNVTLMSLDGLLRIERVVAPRMRVGAAILAAEALIRDLLADLTDDADPVLRQIVYQIITRGEGGTIAPSRLLEFIRLDIAEPRWQEAQRACRDALESDGTAVYFRAYTRSDAQAPWEQVPLDFSRFGPGPDAAPEAGQEAA